VFLEIYFNFIKYRLIPIIYVLISFLFFINIDLNFNLFLSFNIFIFSIIIFDTFSYLFGKLFGKRKLIKVSPNKTVEGLIGGFFSSFVLSLLLSYFLNFTINFELIFYLSFVIIFAFIGDVIESFFKRKNDLKNSSNLIPGHGGVFDRFDSFLFSIVFYSISITF
tara:strand:- start:70 stop:564 length:495 start_codon:yes stop_codon:yes gene_type:complete